LEKGFGRLRPECNMRWTPWHGIVYLLSQAAVLRGKFEKKTLSMVDAMLRKLAFHFHLQDTNSALPFSVFASVALPVVNRHGAHRLAIGRSRLRCVAPLVGIGVQLVPSQTNCNSL
jgi:hypothetical protein